MSPSRRIAIEGRHGMKRPARRLLAGATLSALAACAGDGGEGERQSLTTRVMLGLANLPNAGFSGRVVEDVAFGEHGLAMDLYMPEGVAPEGGHPVVVFFHGGAWQTGERGQYGFVGAALAGRGFTVAIPDYRKYPEVRFPAFVEDGAAAVAAVRGLAEDHGIDADGIILAGHSAGGHTAALLAYDQRYLDEAGVPMAAITAVAGLAGPYHFSPVAETLKTIFGPPERYPDSWTGRYVEPGEPPILMQIGADDRVVGQVNIERLSEALADAGVCHESAIYDGLDHAGLVAELTWYFRDDSPVFADLVAYLRRAAAGGACGFDAAARGVQR